MSDKINKATHELIIKRLLDQKAPILIVNVNKISKN